MGFLIFGDATVTETVPETMGARNERGGVPGPRTLTACSARPPTTTSLIRRLARNIQESVEGSWRLVTVGLADGLDRHTAIKADGFNIDGLARASIRFEIPSDRGMPQRMAHYLSAVIVGRQPGLLNKTFPSAMDAANSFAVPLDHRMS